MRRDRSPDGDSTRDRKRELGIELLASLEEESLPLPEAIDRIETSVELYSRLIADWQHQPTV